MTHDKRTARKITGARVHEWLDTDRTVDGAYPMQYGVQVRAGGVWVHVAVGGKAALFDTPALAEANAVEIMRQFGAEP